MSARMFLAKAAFALVVGFTVSAVVWFFSEQAEAHTRRPMSTVINYTPTHWYHDSWDPIWGRELSLYVSPGGVDAARRAYANGAAAGALAMCGKVPTWWGTGACAAVVGANHGRITYALAQANRHNKAIRIKFGSLVWPGIYLVTPTRG